MFKEAKLDIIKAAKAGTVDAVVITTNTVRKSNGLAVMGAGIALAAAKAWPELARDYGRHLAYQDIKELIWSRRYSENQAKVVCMPTKRDWRDSSHLDLIDSGLKQLVELANDSNWKNVLLPRPGCSLGGLDWERQVHPVCAFHLDERFTVCSL